MPIPTIFDNLDAGNYKINGELHRLKDEDTTDLVYDGEIRFTLNVYPPAGRRRPYVLRHLYMTNVNWAEYTITLVIEDYEFRYDPNTLQKI